VRGVQIAGAVIDDSTLIGRAPETGQSRQWLAAPRRARRRPARPERTFEIDLLRFERAMRVDDIDERPAGAPARLHPQRAPFDRR